MNIVEPNYLQCEHKAPTPMPVEDPLPTDREHPVPVEEPVPDHHPYANDK